MMTNWELIDSVRKDIIGELDAINQYERHVSLTDDERAKRVWQDIANEEKVHVGELFTLLYELDPVSAHMFMEGQEESKELLEKIANKK